MRAALGAAAVSAERARFIDFTPPVRYIEQGDLVAAGSPIAKFDDVDRPGVRVGVLQGSTSQGVLSGQLKNAALLMLPSPRAALESLAQRRIDRLTTDGMNALRAGAARFPF